MSDALLIALAGLAGAVCGAAASLLSPWAQWGVEKRRETRAHRRALVESWRTGLAEWESRDHRYRTQAVLLPWYGSLAPYLGSGPRRSIEAPRTVVVGPENRPGSGSLIQSEIDRIEKKWGLA